METVDALVRVDRASSSGHPVDARRREDLDQRTASVRKNAYLLSARRERRIPHAATRKIRASRGGPNLDTALFHGGVAMGSARTPMSALQSLTESAQGHSECSRSGTDSVVVFRRRTRKGKEEKRTRWVFSESGCRELSRGRCLVLLPRLPRPDGPAQRNATRRALNLAQPDLSAQGRIYTRGTP